jgi:hypothetical protein
MRYIAKSKSTEASMGLRKMYEGSRTYFMDIGTQRGTAGALALQFPTSEPLTPALSCCTNTGKKCPANAAAWATDSWTALHFDIADPNYYRYEYASSGTDTASAFTARAVGDLDCDTKLSTFEMTGKANGAGRDISGSAGIFKKDEVE